MTSKRVTSFDVAKLAGVSRSVVSAILNGTQGIGVGEEKRKAVLAAIQELNYQVDAHARAMKTGLSRCLAAYGNVTNPLFLQVLEGMQEACAIQGYYVLLYPLGPLEHQKLEGLLDLFLQRRIDGIVALDRPHLVNEAWVELVNTHRLPYISVEGYPEQGQIASVLMDYRDSIHRALDFIWERTALPPAYLELYHEHIPLGSGDKQRREAYIEWMTARRLEPIVYSAADGSWDERSGFWSRWVTEHGGSLAVLSNWSRGAVYVSRAAQLLGMVVGQDIHVMASDNTERINQHMYPPLTSVEVPYVEMGRLAAQQILEVIDGRRAFEDKSNSLVSAQLVVRESVGKTSLDLK